jgi:hypothetical protein
MIERLKIRILAFAAAWALLAFVAWHYESSCGVFFSAECGARYWVGLRWIVLLKWVAPYQTLLGGLAALAAGTFVLLAARASAAEAERMDNMKRKRAAVVACSIVSDEFRDAISSLSNWDILSNTTSPFKQTPTYMPVLHEIDPLFGSIVSAQKRQVEDVIVSASRNLEKTRPATARCYASSHLLLSVADRLQSNGTYDLSNGGLIPAGNLEEKITRIPFNPKSLAALYPLFDWSKK